MPNKLAQKYIRQVETARKRKLGSRLQRRPGETTYQRGQREIEEQAARLKAKIDGEVIKELKDKNWFERFIDSITDKN